MKELFLNNSINLLNKQYNYDNDTLDKVKYGLEVIYIILTKTTVILIISIIFNTFKETILTMIFVNFLRIFAYGLHAKKSWHCYISSIFAFIIAPMFFTNLELVLYQKIVIFIATLLSFILFAPADTYKRPLVNDRHRKKLKIETILVAIIYITLCFIIKNNYIVNLLILSLIIESIIINPFIYKIFGLSYDNYKSYKKACN